MPLPTVLFWVYHVDVPYLLCLNLFCASIDLSSVNCTNSNLFFPSLNIFSKITAGFVSVYALGQAFMILSGAVIQRVGRLPCMIVADLGLISGFLYGALSLPKVTPGHNGCGPQTQLFTYIFFSFQYVITGLVMVNYRVLLFLCLFFETTYFSIPFECYFSE